MTPLLTSQGDAGKLGELIERVEKLTGPDRELDYRLAYALGWRFNGFEWKEQSRDQPHLSDEQFADLHMMAGGWKRPDEAEWPYPGTNSNDVPLWTSSIDAALALVERALPGWGCQVGRPIQTYTSGWYASVFRERLPGEHDIFAGSFSDFAEDRGGRPRDSYRQNGAIAIILATLRALKTLSGERHG